MAKGLTEAFIEKLDHGSGIGECFEALSLPVSTARIYMHFSRGGRSESETTSLRLRNNVPLIQLEKPEM